MQPPAAWIHDCPHFFQQKSDIPIPSSYAKHCKTIPTKEEMKLRKKRLPNCLYISWERVFRSLEPGARNNAVTKRRDHTELKAASKAPHFIARTAYTGPPLISKHAPTYTTTSRACNAERLPNPYTRCPHPTHTRDAFKNITLTTPRRRAPKRTYTQYKGGSERRGCGYPYYRGQRAWCGCLRVSYYLFFS